VLAMQGGKEGGLGGARAARLIVCCQGTPAVGRQAHRFIS
jgi:hypothetical protein